MILLDPLARPVIGHRGNRAHAPENTIASMLAAVAVGVDAMEFDVHVCADERLVVVHDATLDRTTDASGPVAQRTSTELARLDAGHRFTRDGGQTFPFRGQGISIPTFDETIDALPATLPLIIELKTPKAGPLIDAAIRRHAIAHRVIVAGFDASAVRPLRGHGYALGASSPDVAALLLPSLFRQHPRCLPYQALCIPPTHKGIPLPIGAMARAIRRAGTVMHLWTINTQTEANRFWQKGVQGIISDDPALIIAARSARH